jgi:putative ABC transport system permease protein
MTRLTSFLLRLFPRSFRQRYGGEMQQLMTEMSRHHGSGFAFWRFMLTDVLVTLAHSWLDTLTTLLRTPYTALRTGALGGVGHDLRYAARGLIRSPLFTMVAAVTLALGIGANTAIFGLVHQLVMKPLQYHDSERLVAVWAIDEQSGRDGIQVSYGDIMDIAEQNEVFGTIGVIYRDAMTVGSTDGPARVTVRHVSTDFFRTIGVNAALGRTFVEEDVINDGERQQYVVLLSHAMWISRGADPDIVGQTIAISGTPVEVIGVLPTGFDFEFPEAGASLWFPLTMSDDMRSNRSFYGFESIARLRPGVTLDQARANLATIGDRLEASFFETNAHRGFTAVPLHDEVVGDTRPMLLMLMGVVGFVLLIACANVANLLLSRLTARRRELAVRTAIGAPRSRLLRQLLTEALLLATLGAALGVALAYLGVEAMTASNGDPRVQTMRLEWPVLMFATGVTVVTALLFGAAPGLLVSKLRPTAALHEGTRASEGTGTHRLRQGLVVAQVAVALTLLIGAGLLVSSLGKALSVDPGFDRERVLTFKLSLPGSDYPDPRSATAWYTELVSELRALPGVEAVGVTSHMPLSGATSSSWFTVDGRTTPEGEMPPTVGYNRVMPGYFQAMGIPLLRGRDFSQADVDQERHVTIISQAVARQIFPDEDPIGQRAELGPPLGDWHEIIGVVGDTKGRGLIVDMRPEAYDLMGPHWDRANAVAVRATGDPALLGETVRRVVTRLEDQAPVYQLATMDDLASERLQAERDLMSMVSAFAIVALVLAAIGIYGVMAYGVSQRTKEIGIRLALGGRRNDILGLVIGQGMRLISLGLVLGVGLALLTTRALESMLFGVSASDPATFGIVAVGLGMVGLFACWLPAVRAGKVDPVVAIRME